MQWMMLFIALFGGFAAGALAIRTACGKRLRDRDGELEELRLKNAAVQSTLDAREKQYEAEKTLLENSFSREIKTLKENHEQKLRMLSEHSQAAFAELEKTHQARHAQLKEEFKVLSDRILEEKSGKLQNANKEQLAAILNPLREKLGEFKTAVEDSKNKGIELASSLTAQLGKMMEETSRIGGEARNLANALKGEQKTQGDWGELILEDILQRSGLNRGIHYETQETIRDIDGKVVIGDHEKRMRPDVIVHFPDGKDVIIDSKVSISAYVDYMNSEDEESRQNALTRHVRSVKNHVAELIRKDYPLFNSKSGRDTVDFVVMFIPGEGPFQLAMLSDVTLWNEAFKNKVMIVSPVNLMALLKIIHIAWSREEQSRNQQDILDTAAQLMERLYAFYEDYDQIGTTLEKLQNCYDKATRRLKQGNRSHSIVNSGEKLKKLGVQNSKNAKLPARLIDLENEAE